MKIILRNTNLVFEKGVKYVNIEGVKQSEQGFFNSNGVFTPFSGYKATSFDVDASKTYVVTTQLSGTIYGVLYVGSDGVVIDKAFKPESGALRLSREELSLPAGTTKILVNLQPDGNIPNAILEEKIV